MKLLHNHRLVWNVVLVAIVDAEPARLNYMEYVADEVNPQVQALKAQATDDDPATKREERSV